MANLQEKLNEWIKSETTILYDNRLSEVPDLSLLTEGKQKRVFSYIIKHTRSVSEAQKIKRILKVKRLEAKKTLSALDIEVHDKLRKDIEISRHKLTYLENTVTELIDDIQLNEEKVVKVKEEVEHASQKLDVVECLASAYHDKSNSLSQIHEQIKMLLHDKNLLKISHISSPMSSPSEVEVRDLYMFRLKQVFTDNAYKNHEGKEMYNMTAIDSIVSNVTLPELLYILNENLNSASLDWLFKSTVFNKTTSTDSLSNINSSLREMKLQYINHVYSCRKLEKEICELTEECDLKKINLASSLNDSSPLISKLIDKKAENIGLSDTLRYLESSLATIKNKCALLKEDLNMKNIDQNAVVALSYDYNMKFNTYISVSHKIPHSLDLLRKVLSELQYFAGSQMFLSIPPALDIYATEAKDELKNNFHSLINVSLQQYSFSPTVPDKLFNPLFHTIGHPYQNTLSILYGIKNMIDLSQNAISHLSYAENNVKEMENSKLSAQDQYEVVLQYFEEIEAEFESSETIAIESFKLLDSIQVNLNDWWEQGAQFLPNIVCEEKSLKMWLDILHVLKNLS